MRVVATRIEGDGTMQRRVVDTARCSDGPEWEDLARRALAVPPPYRPVPGAPIYQVNLDGDREVLVAEHDLRGPLLDLVTALLAMGEEVLARPGTPGWPKQPETRRSSRVVLSRCWSRCAGIA
jgi:hypothetical protein